MLTLTNALALEGYTVYRDDAVNHAFYLLPDKAPPAIALGDDGKPIFSLIVYRRDEERLPDEASGEDVGGGIMTFTAEMPVPQDDIDSVRSKLRTLVWGEDPDEDEDIELSVVPFKKGRVAVTVAGEQADEDGEVEGGEFVRTVAGEGEVSAIGTNRKGVMVKLTQAGAALFSQIEDLPTLPINIEYRLVFEHRLDGVTMTVWFEMESTVELKKQIDAAAKYHDYGYWGESERKRRAVTHVTENLVRSRNLGVTVTPHSSEIDEETLLTLEKFGFDLLTKHMEDLLEVTPPTDEQRVDVHLEEYLSSARNSLNFRLDRKMVLEKPFIPSGAVRGIDPDTIVFVDLRTAFFSFLQVPIRVNAPFADLPLDSVTVSVTYARESLTGGGREVTTKSFNFKDAATIHSFRAFADSLRDVAYDWEAEVFYKGSPETMTVGRRGVRDRFLVVAVGDLGLLDVDLGLGLVDLEKYPQAHVHLSYDSAALGRRVETSFVLSKDKQTARWTEVIREAPDAGYRYKVEWRAADGRTVETDEQVSHAGVLRVDAPQEDTLQVVVSAVGDFKDTLSQVHVTLRYEDPDNDYLREGTLTFTSETQRQVWEPELVDREKRDYRYRYVVVHKSGLVKEVPEDGGWLEGEPGFLVAGLPADLEVEIIGALLTYDDRTRMVKVDLTCQDAASAGDREASFVFSKDSPAVQTWRVDLRDGGERVYHAEVEYFGATGEVTRKSLGLLREKKLILSPLPAPDEGGG